MRKIIFILVFILLLTIIIIGCSEEEQLMISRQQISYTAGWPFHFEYRWFEEGEPIVISGRVARSRLSSNALSESFGYPYTELVFVHNEEEAMNFPEYVLVGWPDSEFTPAILRRFNATIARGEDELILNGRALRDVINLEDFGLTYPITFTDIVDHWEKVFEVFNSLSAFEQDMMTL